MTCGRKLKNKVKLALVTRIIYHYPQKICNLFHKPQCLAPRQFSKISQHFVEWVNIKETIQKISKIFLKVTGCESKIRIYLNLHLWNQIMCAGLHTVTSTYRLVLQPKK